MLYLGQVRCCVWVSSEGRGRGRGRGRVWVRVRVRVSPTWVWVVKETHQLDVLGGQDDFN